MLLKSCHFQPFTVRVLENRFILLVGFPCLPYMTPADSPQPISTARAELLGGAQFCVCTAILGPVVALDCSDYGMKEVVLG